MKGLLGGIEGVGTEDTGVAVEGEALRTLSSREALRVRLFARDFSCSLVRGRTRVEEEALDDPWRLCNHSAAIADQLYF